MARSIYVQQLEELLACPCEILQRDGDDQLLIFVQGVCQDQEQMLRRYPELYPYRLFFLSEFPRSQLGKIDRQGLWALAKGDKP